jgi:prepilin-type N-terminal cleavage/methylation domain-containing protein
MQELSGKCPVLPNCFANLTRKNVCFRWHAIRLKPQPANSTTGQELYFRELMNRFIQKGFTLIELMIVACIIGILAAALPVLSGLVHPRQGLRRPGSCLPRRTAITETHQRADPRIADSVATCETLDHAAEGGIIEIAARGDR